MSADEPDRAGPVETIVPPPIVQYRGGDALPSPGVSSRRLLRAAMAVGLVALCLWMARSYLSAVLWAIIIAIAIWPVYRRVRHLVPGGRAWLAPLIATLVVATLVTIPVFLALTEVGREGHAIVTWLGEAQRSGLPVPAWATQLPLVGQQIDTWWRSHLGNPKDFGNLLGNVDIDALTAWTSSIGGALAYRMLLALLTFLTLFLLLRDGSRIGARLLDLCERWLGHPGEQLFEKMVGVVRGVVNGTVIVAFAEGILIGIGYALAGLQHTALFVILTIAFAMLPLGAWFAFGAASIALLIQGSTLLAALAVLGWGAVVMMIGDNVVQPVLIGGAARLPFLWTLIGILGGLETFGLVGIFLGPVVAAAVLTIWREWIQKEAG